MQTAGSRRGLKPPGSVRLGRGLAALTAGTFLAMSSEEPERPASASPYVSQTHEWTEGLGGYRVVVEAEGSPAWEFVLTGLAGPITTYDLASLRMGRHGGSTLADEAHQQTLFSVLGAIAVAGGHIEAEMKRIILISNEGRKSGFDEVDLTWTDLEKELLRIAAGEGAVAQTLAPVLAWGLEHNIKTMRDHAVHSAWCLHDIGHVQAGRFQRKSSGASLQTTFDELTSTVADMFTYLDGLQRVVNWPTAVLPPLQLSEIALPTFSLQIADRRSGPALGT